MMLQSTGRQPQQAAINQINIVPRLSTLLLIILFVFSYVSTHPAPSVTCHGPISGVRYRYEYDTSLTLNNNNNLEPAGFRVGGNILLESLWQDKQTYLLLVECESIQFKPRTNVRRYQFSDGPVLTDWKPVLVKVDGATGQALNLYVPKSDKGNHHLEPTHMNIVVSVVNSLRNRFDPSEEVITNFLFFP